MRTILFLGLILAAGGLFLHLQPQWDIAASRLFFENATGTPFPLEAHPFCQLVHKTAVYGSRFLGGLLVIGTVFATWRKKNIFSLNSKALFFLLLALVIGPGLIANAGFKDNWHRARPHMIIEFGGDKVFTPALTRSDQCAKNCSFVAGDGAFGFYLVAFAFVVPLAAARRTFWLCFSAGSLFALNRVVMGGHFLSDVIFAALFMLLSIGLIYYALFGKKALYERCKAIT